MPVTKMTGLDFERLSETSMEFGDDWLDQIADGRFSDNEGFQFKQIYWYENYVSARFASMYLETTKELHVLNFDQILNQWVILTDYVGA